MVVHKYARQSIHLISVQSSYLPIRASALSQLALARKFKLKAIRTAKSSISSRLAN